MSIGVLCNDCGENEPVEENGTGLCSECYDKFLKELKIYNLLKGGNKNAENKKIEKNS